MRHKHTQRHTQTRTQRERERERERDTHTHTHTHTHIHTHTLTLQTKKHVARVRNVRLQNALYPVPCQFITYFFIYLLCSSDRVSRMQEAGVIAHILQKWTPEPKRCEVPDSTSAIGLEQAQTAFYVLGTGMGLAVLSCLLEVWCGQTDMFKVKTKRKNCDQRIACITHDSIPGRTWAS